MKLIVPKCPVIAVDFDGTIVENKFPHIGNLKSGFLDWYMLARKNGCALVLWTCREEKLLSNAVRFLTYLGVHFDSYNENCSSFKSIKARKINAHLYIDDRAGFESWEKELVRLNYLLKNWKNM